MDIRSLNKTLKADAEGLGLCQGWRRMWKEGWDRQQLISKYKEGIDFCIKNRYPDKRLIKENFSRDLLRENAVLVDDSWSLLNSRVAVLLGKSSSTIRYNGWNAGTVYVTDNSSVTMKTSGMAFVIVHLFDNAQIDCSATDKASVLILRHSDNSIVLGILGNVKVKDEFDYLSGV